MLECVINISEGRRADVLAALAAACGPALLDVHTDIDHHRSVFTIGGEPGRTGEAALSLARATAASVDIGDHAGVHPRLGAVDVVPFVALGATDPALAVSAARRFAIAVAGDLDLPVFFYDQADPGGRTLPSVRRDAFARRLPDHGPHRPHPTLGAVAVGARPPLVAVNCELASADLALARHIAATIRERDGGMAGVRALGLLLASRDQAQVSMNLVDLDATGIEAAVRGVRAQAASMGTEVTAVELVGLLPAAELARCSEGFLNWAGLGPELTIEARLVAGSSSPSRGD